METGKIAKQMIDFQKTAFDNTFGAMVALQDQTEKMVNITIEQSAWLPKEGKKAINEWTEACKKGRDDFKKFVDENFSSAEGFFAGQAKSPTSSVTSPAKSK
jgi:hypothetical protein